MEDADYAAYDACDTTWRSWLSNPVKSPFRSFAKAWLPPIIQDGVRRLLRAPAPEYPKEGMHEFQAQGLTWRLDMKSNIAREMIATGSWERDTTDLVNDMVKPGMKVMSVGANFGYYVLLMARLVGDEGHVWAFEPTQYYRDQLQWHLEKNGLASRVTVVPYGLSDGEVEATIDISPQSASMHYSPQEVRLFAEAIQLKRLDDVAEALGIGHLQFVSLDIDGHEAAFLRGAKTVLGRSIPSIAMEFAQECLHFAGSDVREVALLLKEIGYEICSEKTRKPFPNELAFLKECGNFRHYANALAVRAHV
jgi:FkbM family methyltransferase